MVVRFAVLLGLLLAVVARADDEDAKHFHRVALDELVGYIVPEEYAAAHKAEFEANIPGAVRIEGFWTPGETSAIVADRVLRVLIHRAAKEPLLLFPDLAPDTSRDAGKADESDKEAQLKKQQRELAFISDKYVNYVRQYVGVIIDKQRLVFCNYSVGTKGDPAREFLFTEKFFNEHGGTHFLQCRYDPEEKTCTNISMIGPWRGD